MGILGGLGNFTFGAFGQGLASIWGLVGGVVNTATSLVKDGVNAMLQYNQAGVDLAKQMGMSAREAQAYTEVLVDRASKLGIKYGVAAEQVIELQRNLAASTGKALMLNDAENERMLQINKLVGSNVSNEFVSTMMNNMGAQLSTVQGAVSKAYATAAKSGLNAAQFSEKVARNLSLANKLSFRDGVNGIIRMTALSEKLGFNLQSIESAAGKFLELDESIQNSAQLQMLGGSAAVYGGNPLEMAYEANYDPEAFTERMTKTLSGYATFDKKTGMATVNGMNRDFVNNIAKAMGISQDEAMSIAKKQAEIKYKEGAYGTELGKISKENRDFVLNKSYIDTETGHLMMNDVSGGTHDITKDGMSEELIKEMQKFEGKSDSEIMKEQAMTLKSIKDSIEGYKTSIMAEMAKPFIGKTKEIQQAISKVGDMIMKDVVPGVQKFITDVVDWFGKNKGTILEVLKTIGKVVGFIFQHIKWILIAVLAIKAGKFLRNTYQLGKAIRAKTPTWLGGTKGATSGAGGAAAVTNGSRFAKAKNFGKNLVKRGTKYAKGAAALGVAVGAYQGISAISDYSSRRDDLNRQYASGAISKQQYDSQLNQARTERNAGVGEGVGTAAGAVIGSIAGPLGAVVGGWLGGMGGKLIGQHWDKISKKASEVWDGISKFATGIWKGISSVAKGVWNGILSAGKTVWNFLLTGLKAIINAITAPFRLIIYGIISAINLIPGVNVKRPKLEFATGGIVGGHSEKGDKVLTGLNSGEMVLNKTQQSNLFKLIDGLNGGVSATLENRNDVKAKPVGGKEYIYTPQNGGNGGKNETSISVRDINVNISGTIRLDGGKYGTTIDANSLLGDMAFVSSLKDLIKESINTDMNGGRFMNDLATIRGGSAPLSIIGRK